MIKLNKKVVFLLSAFCLHTAVAAPIQRTVNVVITCPLIIDHHSSPVKNYGQYLYGSGTERHGNNAQKIKWFRGIAILGLKIPLNLVESGYYNDGVAYNKATGAVICRYNTTKGFDRFALVYMIPDGMSGSVHYEDSGKIKLKLPIKKKS